MRKHDSDDYLVEAHGAFRRAIEADYPTVIDATATSAADSLYRLAGAVEALVKVVGEQVSTSRTVDLDPVEQIGGPAGELIGYVVVRPPDWTVLTNAMSIERAAAQADALGGRLAVVHHLPQEVHR